MEGRRLHAVEVNALQVRRHGQQDFSNHQETGVSEGGYSPRSSIRQTWFDVREEEESFEATVDRQRRSATLGQPL